MESMSAEMQFNLYCNISATRLAATAPVPPQVQEKAAYFAQKTKPGVYLLYILGIPRCCKPIKPFHGVLWLANRYRTHVISSHGISFRFSIDKQIL